MRLKRLFVFTTLLGAVAACDCDGDISNVSRNEITIESPLEGESVFASGEVVFRAKATNPGGLELLALRIGEGDELDTLHECSADEAGIEATCEHTFKVKDYGALIENQTILLTAFVRDAQGDTAEETLRVNVKPIVVKIRRPVKGPEQARAKVALRDALELTVESAIDVEVAEVSLRNASGDELVRRYRNAPYRSTDVQWPTLADGPGDYDLIAGARDTDGNADTVILPITILCSEDTHCTGGKRCCPEDGTCYDPVARGAECSCQKPCPGDQACLPGICGSLPKRCRPGCYPGGEQRGQYAERCSPQQGPNGEQYTAYCTRLPSTDATPLNEGGACAVADGCNVVTQNCPDLPLDRTRPAGDDNPPVAHTCVPVSPVANTCMPAGSIRLGGTNCDYNTCGDSSAGCIKGLLCVTTIDQNGDPIGPSRCEKQCNDPWDGSGFFPPQSRSCATGEYCGQLLGAGQEPIATGVCNEGAF